MIVLDASVALAWLFAEELPPQALALFDESHLSQLVVPSLWHLEVGDVLVIAERKGRISPEELARYVNDLRGLPIKTVDEHPEIILDDILPLARREKLTVYDAAYLHLAMRLKMPLATLDDALRAAATRCDIALLPEER